jgi:ribosomal protein S18 acetylase RimI-like enzyme
VVIRRGTLDDLPAVIALDQSITGMAKEGYWSDLFKRFEGRSAGRAILIAEDRGAVRGFIIGEVRAWEFGEPPCGWVFALEVDASCRERGLSTRLFDKICDFFKVEGVSTVRTMLRRDDVLLMSFFRSQGMMAGPFIQLEKELEA